MPFIYGYRIYSLGNSQKVFFLMKEKSNDDCELGETIEKLAVSHVDCITKELLLQKC